MDHLRAVMETAITSAQVSMQFASWTDAARHAIAIEMAELARETQSVKKSARLRHLADRLKSLAAPVYRLPEDILLDIFNFRRCSRSGTIRTIS